MGFVDTLLDGLVPRGSTRQIQTGEVKLAEGEIAVMVWDRPSKMFVERSIRKLGGFDMRVVGGTAKLTFVIL